ncbi:MAG: PEP/pyruvate-binding domain-containing protein [Verrucomicrobiales bacterium]
MKLSCAWRRLALLLAVVGGWHAPVSAVAPDASEAPLLLGPDAAGRFGLSAPPMPGRYFRLWRADSLGGPMRCIGLRLGGAAPVELRDPLPMARQGYYRVEVVPIDAPLDADGDGESDLLELARQPSFASLNPARSLDFEDGAVFIPDWATFELLSHRDNFPGAVGVREVKFLVSGADGSRPALYFLNTNTRRYHYDFARSVLGFARDLEYWDGLVLFNEISYFTNTRRQFIAGSFVHHPHFTAPGRAPGLYTVEFWPADPVGEKFVREAVELVAASAPFVQGALAYHAASETQRTLKHLEEAAYTASPIPTIDTEQLFSDVTYTMLNPGVAFGRLRLIQGNEVLSARDIPVFRTLPNDLSRVAGVISATPQTPLSHVNLKARQNNMPNCYIRNAETDPTIISLLGKNVRLEAKSDGLLLREATQAEVEEHLEKLRPSTPQVPVRNLSRLTIQRTSTLAFADSRSFGAKAANLAEMARWLPAGTVPTGFAVPYYFYDEFMRYNGFDAVLDSILSDEGFRTDPARRERMLRSFRSVIRRGQVPAWMYPAFDAVTVAYPADTPLRCRSSSNGEDLIGFNGAGLYDSFTHRPPDEGHLMNTIRQVWASLWNYRAFEEREFARVEHRAAAMGVLIHPNFDDEKVNGVAVSRNIFDPNWRGVYVNSQLGEALVTNPSPDSVPEEMLVAALLGAARYEIQYIRFSSLVPRGTPLLTQAQAFLLADRLRIIEQRFRPLYGRSSDPDFAMEVEFKITRDDRLVIKQARPWVD